MHQVRSNYPKPQRESFTGIRVAVQKPSPDCAFTEAFNRPSPELAEASPRPMLNGSNEACVDSGRTSP